jgi:hypothetical protein
VSSALNQTLVAGGTMYFVWSYSVTSGNVTTNAQALGIDNVVITGFERQIFKLQAMKKQLMFSGIMLTLH